MPQTKPLNVRSVPGNVKFFGMPMGTWLKRLDRIADGGQSDGRFTEGNFRFFQRKSLAFLQRNYSFASYLKRFRNFAHFRRYVEQYIQSQRCEDPRLKATIRRLNQNVAETPDKLQCTAWQKPKLPPLPRRRRSTRKPRSKQPLKPSQDKQARQRIKEFSKRFQVDLSFRGLPSQSSHVAPKQTSLPRPNFHSLPNQLPGGCGAAPSKEVGKDILGGGGGGCMGSPTKRQLAERERRRLKILKRRMRENVPISPSATLEARKTRFQVKNTSPWNNRFKPKLYWPRTEAFPKLDGTVKFRSLR